MRMTTFLLISLITSGSWLFAQSEEPVSVTAIVEPDSGKDQIRVEDLKIEFKFAGYGYYLPSDYPVMREIPLENGEIVSLDKIAEATFRARRVQWKKFIPENERANYDDVDKDGYRHWSAVEVDTWIRDWDGNVIKSRIKRPEYSDVFLIGRTSRGAYSLQIDQENNKTVHVIFEPNFVMQCPKDKSHVFPNSSYVYCPYCGKKLKRIMKPATLGSSKP